MARGQAQRKRPRGLVPPAGGWSIEELTPAPFNVGSRVHEYGGGAYAAAAGVVVFSERTNGSVWRIEAGQPPRQIATPDGCRYADFEFDLPRRRVLAVREDHRGRPPTDPKATIVALPLDPGGTETILIEGPDFLSSPRLSPDGERLCWIAWDHPGMPWDGTKLFVAEVTRAGALETAQLAAGETPEAIVQPEWASGRRPLFLLRPDRLVESLCCAGRQDRTSGAGRSRDRRSPLGLSSALL